MSNKHSQYCFVVMSCTGAFSTPELRGRCMVFILLYFPIFALRFLCLIITRLLHSRQRKKKLISDCYRSKRKRKTKQREHLCRTEATVEVTYCSVPVGYTVVIDLLTRAEWFLSPWGATHSVCSLCYRGKKTTTVEDVQGRFSPKCSDVASTLWRVLEQRSL